MGLRVTLGERLGMTTVVKVGRPPRIIPDDPVPREIEPELAGPIVRLASCPSSTLPYGHPVRREDDGGPPRVTGHMEWLHKSVPALVIHGRTTISPEEYAAGRRR